MARIFGIVICIIAGLGLFCLSLINDSLSCDRISGMCNMQSKLAYVNYEINSDKFKVSDISSVTCEKMYQPARSGKKAYFVLKIKNLNNEYNLGSYRKLPECKARLNNIKDFKSGHTQTLEYSSGFGITNCFGFILGILLFVIAYIILTTQEQSKTYDWEDDNDES